MFDDPELYLLRFDDPERDAERERRHAQALSIAAGRLALTLLELGLPARDVEAWSQSLARGVFVTVPVEGGDPCRCSCHPQLPSLQTHDGGVSCSCQRTAEQRAQQAGTWRAQWEAHDASPEAAAARARHQSEQDDVASWLAGEPGVVVSSFGGWAPEQWTGSVDGHSFSFRERHEQWRIELDLRPSGRVVQAWTGGDAGDEASYAPRELEEGDVIAEGVVDVPGYGTTPVERGTFIARTVRDHLRRKRCIVHEAGLALLERALAEPPRFCPACGTPLA